MRQSAAWGLYVVSGTTAHQACVAVSLLLGGHMCYQGLVTPEQLTGFIFYVQVGREGGREAVSVCQCGGALSAPHGRERARARGRGAPRCASTHPGPPRAPALRASPCAQLVTSSSLAVCDQYGSIMEVGGRF
jgi:hypothetical protein